MAISIPSSLYQRAIDGLLKAYGESYSIPLIPGAFHLPTVFAEYCLDQKDVKRSRFLTPRERTAASAEWSRQLRERVNASKKAERHQVLVDLQDEP